MLNNLQLQGKGPSGGSDFAAMVQAMRVYVTVDSNSACPTDFMPVGISHYKTLNTVSYALFKPCLLASHLLLQGRF